MEEMRDAAAAFKIESQISVSNLRAAFADVHRLRIADFLASAGAVRLYEQLSRNLEWRTFVVANERLYGAPVELKGIYTPEQERELADCAQAGALNGFACCYDADRPPGEDLGAADGNVSIVRNFLQFVNSADFIEFSRSVTGIAELARADVRATRFRSGHFMTFHDGTRALDPQGKRRIDYILHCTPQWKPEWGGSLETRSNDGSYIMAFEPDFNVLDLFPYPLGRWVTMVTPFASGACYAVRGSLYLA